MSPGEWIALAAIIVTIFIAICGGIGAVLWYFITRDAQRIETGMGKLTDAVSEATIVMRELKVEVASVREDHRNIWGEINRLKENRVGRDSWREDEDR